MSLIFTREVGIAKIFFSNFRQQRQKYGLTKTWGTWKTNIIIPTHVMVVLYIGIKGCIADNGVGN